MKKLIYVLLSLLFICAHLSAARLYLEVQNDIEDKDDPICLKAVNVSIGEVEEMSCQEGEPIGKKFTIKIKVPTITHISYSDYKKSLEDEGKTLDFLTFGNGEKEFSFSLFCGYNVALDPFLKNNITVGYLPSNKGFHLYGN